MTAASVSSCMTGETTTMHGELIEDPSVVADLSRRAAESYGVENAQRVMGLQITWAPSDSLLPPSATVCPPNE